MGDVGRGSTAAAEQDSRNAFAFNAWILQIDVASGTHDPVELLSRPECLGLFLRLATRNMYTSSRAPP